MNRQLFLDLAERLAQESTCLRARVGCVLATREGRIVSVGYNGVPRGCPHCHPSTCRRGEQTCAALHAEQNAVAFASSRLAVRCYSTHSPCGSCLKLLVASGVQTVMFKRQYHEDVNGLARILDVSLVQA